MDFLKSIAPTIASALGGPAGYLAYEAVAHALGVTPDEAKATIESSKMGAEQIAAIQQAEIALKAKALELNLNFEALAVQDRTSARDMQVANKSNIPPVLAVLVTLGFFGILISLMLGYAKTSPELLIMLGSLGTAWAGIIAFYFGSSNGSQQKDILLHQSTPIKG